MILRADAVQCRYGRAGETNDVLQPSCCRPSANKDANKQICMAHGSESVSEQRVVNTATREVKIPEGSAEIDWCCGFFALFFLCKDSLLSCAVPQQSNDPFRNEAP